MGQKGLAGGLVTLACAVMAAPAAAQMPRAVITKGPQGEVASTSATFAFDTSSFAALPSFACRLDGGPWASCRSPHELRNLGGGRHVFEVRLTGRLADPRPDRREWVVKQKTEVLPCGGRPCASPLPEPPAVPPAPGAGAFTPPPPRDARRRDARGCAYAANEPGEVNATRIRRAVRCLINRERTARGRPPLRLNRRLHTAAARHARDMVARRYFDHASPGGDRVGDRVRAAGYLRGARYWTVGEVLAWLVRPRPTPAAVVDAWMRSRPHRAVILRSNFRDIGIAFRRGNPRIERTSGATFAAALGRRTR